MKVSVSEKGYFVFAYSQKTHGVQAEFLGWHKVRLLPHEPEYIEGVLSLLGRQIPVFYLNGGRNCGRAEVCDEACVVVYQCDCLKKHFAAIVTENIATPVDLSDSLKTRFALMAADLADRPGRGPQSDVANRSLSRFRTEFAGCRGRFGVIRRKVS